MDNLAACKLAFAYHDAMTMVSTQSASHLAARVSPRQCLNGYLQLCKIHNVRPHNDAWETRAEAIVDVLTQKRRDALCKALSIPNG